MSFCILLQEIPKNAAPNTQIHYKITHTQQVEAQLFQVILFEIEIKKEKTRK